VGRDATGTLGKHAEHVAFRYLIGEGLRPVARNFRSRGGEIDLIHKQRKIIRTAALFVARNRDYARHVMRFDVVAITGEDTPAIDWIRDAFRPNDSTL
jgi:putative endonuclease